MLAHAVAAQEANGIERVGPATGHVIVDADVVAPGLRHIEGEVLVARAGAVVRRLIAIARVAHIAEQEDERVTPVGAGDARVRVSMEVPALARAQRERHETIVARGHGQAAREDLVAPAPCVHDDARRGLGDRSAARGAAARDHYARLAAARVATARVLAARVDRIAAAVPRPGVPTRRPAAGVVTVGRAVAVVVDAVGAVACLGPLRAHIATACQQAQRRPDQDHRLHRVLPKNHDHATRTCGASGQSATSSAAATGTRTGSVIGMAANSARELSYPRARCDIHSC